jgi:signal transduction histidine kinase
VQPPEKPDTTHDLDVDQLLSMITHELSTPLAVIGGHAEMFADLVRLDRTGPVAVIDALERNIRNLDDLLGSLNGLSQAVAAPGPLTSIELVAFVAQMLSDLGPLLAQHDVRRSLIDRPLAADVEPVAIRQILTNLLSNAVKFTEPGTRIDVIVRAGDHGAELVVADHGPGIPIELEPELFGRFARLGSRARGLGLGLHLSRALARRQGGDLVHQVTRGGGATFVLRLPA